MKAGMTAGNDSKEMALNKALCWYQKKISAYDKQSWEETIEQKILSGLTQVPKKSGGKLKLEYIDLDLVRGSAFPKVKAKHGLGTLIKLGLTRFIFLPLYRHWWTRQTSSRIYNVLLLLYSLQLFNMGVFYSSSGTIAVLNDTLNSSSTTDAGDTSIGEISSEEVLLPILMMCILSVLLSQMVSSHTSSGRPPKRPKSKLRTKRTKRRSNRRISMAVSDSKSSLETLEQQPKVEEPEKAPSFPLKKRSSSEERPPPIKVQQRSSSLQLEPSLSKQSRMTLRRPSWFSFAWPARLGVPSRTNEDEGFDSFHGNNSSSSDVEQEENAQRVNEVKETDKAPERPGLLRRRRQTLGLKLTPPPPPGVEPELDHLHAVIGGGARKSVTIMSCHRRRNASATSTGAAAESSYQSSCESDGDAQSSVASPSYKVSEPGTPVDWTGVTTNSEECSYSSETGSESDQADNPHYNDTWSDELNYVWDLHNNAALSSSFPSSDKVSCTMWEGDELKKADLSVLDISAAIIAKVDSIPESTDYLCGGLLMAAVFSLLPIVYRANGAVRTALVDLVKNPSLEKSWQSGQILSDILLGATFWDKFIAGTAALERFVLAAAFLFLLSVAERTFKQRFLYSKLFSYLTSSRRARNSDLPHFRLNKVRNIKTWLSVRSYLKKRGPQRSVDCIVSTAFVITLLLVSFLCMELLKESQYLHQSLYNLEVLCWCLVLGVFLLRFMTLGSKLNKKYRNLSVLITEQINLYLQMEQKPNKKEELMLANSVLKLAADLLKELESPFKISGFSANPYLYNLTKVVVLSALSGVLSEMLGFKLKLHKIKLR